MSQVGGGRYTPRDRYQARDRYSSTTVTYVARRWSGVLKWLLVIPIVIAMGIGLLLTGLALLVSAAAHQQQSAVTVSVGHSVGLTLTADQEAGCKALAYYMQYDIDAVRAWCASEGNVGNPGQPAYNFLFLSCGVPEESGCVTLAGRKWATFASVDVGAIAMWNNLARQPNLYGGILAAGGTRDPIAQMKAIALSPWDAGHYGSPPGTNLIAAYDGLLGVKVSCSGAHVCAE